MKSFKDAQGRQWLVSVNIGTVERVAALTGFDMSNVADGKALIDLSANPRNVANVLWAICQPEAERTSVDKDGFFAALDGDAVDAATSAIIEEIVNFTRSASRPVLRMALDKFLAVERAAADLATKKLGAMDPQAMVKAAFDAASSNSPASAASTPEGSRSAN